MTSSSSVQTTSTTATRRMFFSALFILSFSWSWWRGAAPYSSRLNFQAAERAFARLDLPHFRPHWPFSRRSFDGFRYVCSFGSGLSAPARRPIQGAREGLGLGRRPEGRRGGPDGHPHDP